VQTSGPIPCRSPPGDQLVLDMPQGFDHVSRRASVLCRARCVGYNRATRASCASAFRETRPFDSRLRNTLLKLLDGSSVASDTSRADAPRLRPGSRSRPAHRGQARRRGARAGSPAWMATAFPGARGLRIHARAWIALDSRECPDGWRRSLLIRRGRENDDEHAYFPCYRARGTALAELVDAAGRRWAVEESSRSSNQKSDTTGTRSAGGSRCGATPSSRCPPQRFSPWSGHCSRQTPPPGRWDDPAYLERDPQAPGNGRPRPRTRETLPAALVTTAPPRSSLRRALAL
jgi:hypothetical protein